ncbi:hypothetical protein AK830_g1618 [Neonectria ditissima]|uniref:DUF7580 domain-containing protein n=1 Tax=Neonectria ditissima TaxID=78410 RepID=A0A0P7BU68_9HYPO|nr:hypothetical protein AK830_g1618 [Neonectria ditissima]
MLYQHWDEAKRPHDEAELEFIHQWLRPGFPKSRDTRWMGPWKVYTSSEINEPPYAVCKVAKSIYDALVNFKGCSCPDQHDFKAKLELGTYRSPAKKSVVKSIRRRVRRSRGDDDASGGLELDMFIFMERDCIVEQYAKVERLCRPITKTKTGTLQRIVLRLKSGELFEIGFEKSNFQIDHNAKPISLSQFFEDRQDFFTEKTKRILSLIIGHTFLHLHGTSWLQPGWGPSNVKFFQTTSCKTPLRPFIEAQLPKAGPKITALGFQSLGDDAEDDDDLSDESDSGVAVQKWWPLLCGRITLMDVDQVFEGEEEDEEGWRSQIPEDSPLLGAIDNCLDAELWEDDEGQPPNSATLRSQMYQKVVRLLELDLTNGYRNSIRLFNLEHR